MGGRVNVVIAVGERLITVEVDSDKLASEMKFQGSMASLMKRRPGQSFLIGTETGSQISDLGNSYDKTGVLHTVHSELLTKGASVIKKK